MRNLYSMEFHIGSARTRFELIQLFIDDWSIDFNGNMMYVPISEDPDDPHVENLIDEEYNKTKFLKEIKGIHDSNGQIWFYARTGKMEWPLLFYFDISRRVRMSFTYLDLPLVEEMKLADINYLLVSVLAFFYKNNCDVIEYTVNFKS